MAAIDYHFTRRASKIVSDAVGVQADWSEFDHALVNLAREADEKIAALSSPASSSPAEELHGPFGHLVIALGLDEEHWRIEDEPVNDADHVSLPMFTKTDPFKHLPAGSEWPRPAEAEALPAGVEAAIDPFRRLLAITDALPSEFMPNDETPLRDVTPGGWPTLGELRCLIAAIAQARTVVRAAALSSPAEGVEAVRQTLEDIYVGKSLLDHVAYERIRAALVVPETACCKGLAPLSECKCEKDRASLSPAPAQAGSAGETGNG